MADEPAPLQAPPVLLGKKDKLEVDWDSRGLWKCCVRREGVVLHIVMGSTVEGVIAESQVALELQGVELCRMFLQALVDDLRRFLEGDQGSYERAVELWKGIPKLPPWEWFQALDAQVRAKLDRLKGMPKLLLKGAQWHLDRVAEYERDLKEGHDDPEIPD